MKFTYNTFIEALQSFHELEFRDDYSRGHLHIRIIHKSHPNRYTAIIKVDDGTIPRELMAEILWMIGLWNERSRFGL